MSFNPLIEKIIELKNPTVAGLDPKLDYVPQYIKEKCFGQYGRTLEGAAEALYEFNTGLIDALCDRMTDTGARSVTEIAKLPMRDKVKMLGSMKNDPCLADFAERMIQVAKQTVLPEKLSQLI